MRVQRILALTTTILLFGFPAHSAQWKTAERIVHYSITGTTGRALYTSIGVKGPRLAGGRKTVAHTTFDLKWRRNYRPKGKTCTLVSAKPFFTIIYTVPKPATRLKNPAARQWRVFYENILVHEKVHGAYAREMVDEIIKTTVGLTVQNDRKCRKIRTEVLTHVKNAYRNYKAKGRVFDQAETAIGGNIRRLVSNLLNAK